MIETTAARWVELDDGWHFCTAVYDDDAPDGLKLKLYLDGKVLDATAPHRMAGSFVANRALDADQIAALYAAGHNAAKRRRRNARALTAEDFTDLGLSAPIRLWNLTNKGPVPFAPGITEAAEAAVFAGATGEALYDGDAPPMGGELLAQFAEQFYGITRAPGESDEDLRARVVALHRSHLPEEKTMPASTPNPYDRRAEGPRRPPTAAEAREFDLGRPAHFDIYADGKAAYQGFGLARLEELLRDEFARGFNSGEATLERKLDEEIMPRARRLTWNEGHGAGYADGQAALLMKIGELFEGDANALIKTLSTFVDEEADPAEPWDRAGKTHVLAMLGSARDLLRNMVEGHHKGFVGDIPF